MLLYFLFLIGFLLLIKGADFLISGASVIGKRLGVSSLIIGLTVVAFGTSLPEMVVNVFASLRGSSDLVVGNILGSNISNTLLILGVSALIFPLKAQKKIIWREIPYGVLAVLVVGALAADAFLDGAGVSQLGRGDGFALLSLFSIFLYAMFSGGAESIKEEVAGEFSVWRAAVYVVVGMAALTLGGKWIVDGAVEIARQIGLSETMIGLTIVAFGTSLPELATSATAAYKRQIAIAIGNVVGSNIFNLLLVLGVNAVIAPVVFEAEHFADWAITLVTALLLFLIMFVGKRHVLQRWQGGIFVGMYVVYIVTRVVLS
ncbi:MAG: calcium/sodium antiporter [Patescibacteria group bacterium]